MIDQEKLKYIDRDKYQFDEKDNSSKKTKQKIKLKVVTKPKIEIPKEKLLLMKRIKAVKEKYLKVNQLTQTKNYNIMDKEGIDTKLMTDSIEHLKLLNPLTPSPLRLSVVCSKKVEKINPITRRSTYDNLESSGYKDLSIRKFDFLLNNEQIAQCTANYNKSFKQKEATVINLTLKNFFPKLTKEKNLNTVSNSSRNSAGFANFPQFSFNNSIKHYFETMTPVLKKDKAQNFIYTREMFPKIEKFNALKVKNECRRASNLIVERKFSSNPSPLEEFNL